MSRRSSHIAKRLIFVLPLLLAAVAAVRARAGEEPGAEEALFGDFEVAVADKRAEKVVDIPASVVVITRKDIETYGYTSLEDILTHIPGLYKIDSYYWYGTMTYGVRGFYSVGSFSDMVVMVNGMQQREEYYESFPFSKIAVPIEAIDRIEVVRGPLSVIYGNGAFFGAINIITDEGKSYDNPSILSASYGTGGDYRVAVRMAHGRRDAEDVGFVVNASGFGTDGIEGPYKKMISNPAGLGAGLSNDGSFKGQLKDDRRFVDISGKFKDFTAYLSHVETTMGIADIFPSVSPRGHQIDVSATNASLDYTKEISSAFSVKGKADSTFYLNNYNYEWFKKDNYTPQIISSKAYALALDSFYTPFHRLNALFGAERRVVESVRSTIDAPDFGDFYANTEQFNEDPIVTDSVYTQLDYKPWDRLKVVSGVRVEKTHDHVLTDFRANFTPAEQHSRRTIRIKTNVVPRVALIYSVTPYQIVKLLYGEATKKPSTGNQLDVVAFPSVASLVPATMKTAEVNILSSWTSRLTTNVSVFRNELDKLISRVETPVNGSLLLLSQNAGKVSTNGLEMGLACSPFDGMSLDISGAYQDTRDETAGHRDITPGYAPRFLGYGKAAYRFMPRATIAALGRYVSKMETSWNDSTKTRLGPRVRPYFVMDANLRFEDLWLKGSSVGFKVSNVFNREIRYPVTGSNQWADLGTLDRGREFLMTVGYKFY